MKKLLKYLGFGILSVIIFFTAIFAITMVGGINKEEVFIPFIKDTVPRLTTWELSEYKSLMSEKAYQSSTQEQWSLYLKMFTKLGSLQSVGNPELKKSNFTSSVGTGTTTYAVYLVPLQFNTGLAHVQIALQHNNGIVEINNVQFLSDLLLQ